MDYLSYVAAGLVAGPDNVDNKLVMSGMADVMKRVLDGDPSIDSRLAWDLLCEVLGTENLEMEYPLLFERARRACDALDDAAEEEVVV